MPRRGWQDRMLPASLVVLLTGCGSVEVLESLPAPTSARCPTGPYGGPMIEVPEPQGGSYCIDRTEVTRTSYLAWYDAGPALPENLPPLCVDDTAYPPMEATESTAGPQRPMTGITWCDAYSFCAFNHKRLCGAIGGDIVLIEGTPPDPLVGGPQDPTVSEWFNACTGGGQHPFAYGDSYDLTRCYDPSMVGEFPHPLAEVGSHANCEGGFAGVMDMLGNAEEYTAACYYWHLEGQIETGWRCLSRGLPNGSCRISFPDEPYAESPSTSFRCCADTLAAP